MAQSACSALPTTSPILRMPIARASLALMVTTHLTISVIHVLSISASVSPAIILELNWIALFVIRQLFSIPKLLPALIVQKLLLSASIAKIPTFAQSVNTLTFLDPPAFAMSANLASNGLKAFASSPSAAKTPFPTTQNVSVVFPNTITSTMKKLSHASVNPVTFWQT